LISVALVAIFAHAEPNQAPVAAAAPKTKQQASVVPTHIRQTQNWRELADKKRWAIQVKNHTGSQRFLISGAADYFVASTATRKFMTGLASAPNGEAVLEKILDPSLFGKQSPLFRIYLGRDQNYVRPGQKNYCHMAFAFEPGQKQNPDLVYPMMFQAEATLPSPRRFNTELESCQLELAADRNHPLLAEAVAFNKKQGFEIENMFYFE
jgi:hypothetical protein